MEREKEQTKQVRCGDTISWTHSIFDSTCGRRGRRLTEREREIVERKIHIVSVEEA